MKRILLIICVSISGFSLTGCDDHLFTQFFRNPHIVEVGKVNTLKANQWYEFKTKAKALNRNQNIVIKFNGGEPDKLSMIVRGLDENFEGGGSVFKSTDFINKEIFFDVIVIDVDNVEYNFEASGRSYGIIFDPKAKKDLIGKVFNKVRIKSNLQHENVHVTWISYTGK